MSLEADNLALHDRHVALEARMGEEAGWLVPLSYASALQEVETVADRAGVCDVSHLARLRIRGDDALDLLERAFSHDAARQEDDTAALTCLCNERGGVLDCGYLLRLDESWLYTGDAGNRLKVVEHLGRLAGDDVRIDDLTPKTSQFAVTGPEAPRLLTTILKEDLAALPFGTVRTSNYLVAKIHASRTGYGPFWSLEAIVPNMLAGQAWDLLTRRAKGNAVSPIGHAARDVLRVEACLPRYGHEIHERIDPLTAGLPHCVSLDHDFIGAEAIARVRDRGSSRRLVRLEIDGPPPPARPSIARLGDGVSDDEGNHVGEVTSGTFSPLSQRVLALAYLQPHAAAAGTELRVGGASARIARVLS